MQLNGLGKADRLTRQALDPGPQRQVLGSIFCVFHLPGWTAKDIGQHLATTVINRMP
jgi:hypothetical protein